MDWKEQWAGVVRRIGSDLTDGSIQYGTDAVEAGAVRHFLEPLEFDCPLHYDIDAARAAGFADITAPYASLLMFAKAAVWRPGESVFASAERNSQPLRLSVKPVLPPEAPDCTSFFVVELDVQYFREVTVHERLGQRGNRLLACVPKEIKAGKGAFITHEREVVDAKGAVVACYRFTSFVFSAAGSSA